MFDERVRDRIIAETRGNPLALLELPRGLTATQLAGGLRDPWAAMRCPAGSRRATFAGSTRSAPMRAVVLLLAAAEPVGDPLLLLRASERLGIARSRGRIGRRTGLLEVGERVTFRHPLVRSAVYRSADADERRAAHLALAEATDRDADPDRRAWHLAAAARGPRRGGRGWSWSARRAGRRRAAASPRRRRSCSARSR